jgi:hypothetical protein
MTSNSRRSSWTTRRPRDRPLRSTPCPQEEGALRSSSCLHARRRRNRHVLRWPLPLLPPTPTMAANARVRARGRGKARTTAPTAPATTAQQQHRRPGLALLLQSLDRHHLDVARDASSTTANDASTAARPTCCTGVLWGSRRPLLRALTGVSTAPAAGHDPCLVALDGHVGSTVIDQLLQHHGLDSPGGHRLGRGLRRLQPHHLRCQ